MGKSKKSFKDYLKEELNIIDVYYDQNYNDCYTFVFGEISNQFKNTYLCLGMDRLGQWYHTECIYTPKGNNEHLGRKINPEKSPGKIKNALKRYKEFLNYIEKEL